MEPLNLCSLNVNGLNFPAKRRDIFKAIRDGNYDVALLQETHCTARDERIWATEWGGKMFFSNGRSNARGVCTLLKRDSPWKISSQTHDQDGRFLSLTLEKEEEKFMITNVSHAQDRTDEIMRWY